jgi:surface polysaccharide O-acyltransferase-like enzyme
VLRGLAIILVVGIHAPAYAGAVPSSLAGWPTVYGMIAAMAVPAFFLCDGVLFARAEQRSRSRGYLETMYRSIRRLLGPWIVFTVIYTIARLMGEKAGLFREFLILGQPPSEIARVIWESRIAPQLYFLPALFLIRCLGPLLRPLAHRPAWLAVLAFGLYQVLLNSSGYRWGSDPIPQAISGFRYYLLGIVVYRYHSVFSAQAMGILAVLVAGLMLLIYLGDGPNPSLLYKFTLLLAAYTSSIVLDRPGRPLGWLGRKSMGIYLLHTPPLMKVAQLVAVRIAPGWAVCLALIWIFSLLASLALTLALERRSGTRALFLGEM